MIIGKPGVPVLTAGQRGTIARIQQRLLPTPRHLRFAFVDLTLGDAARKLPRGSSMKALNMMLAIMRSHGDREFIVYDANAGPCFLGAPGYAVLNDERWWARPGEFYQPGENPYNTHGIVW